MIKRLIVIFLILGLGYSALIFWAVKTRPNDAYAVTCYKTDELISGTKKINFYNCLGKTEAVTISSVELVPLFMEDDTLSK